MSDINDENAILAKYGETSPDTNWGSYGDSALKGTLKGVTAGIAPYAGAVGHMMSGAYNWDQALQASKNEYAQAEQANPNTSLATNIIGGAVPALMTGGESLLGTVGKNALLGSVEGGTSANSLSDVPKEAGIGAAAGTIGSAIPGAIGSIGTWIKNKVGRSALADALEKTTTDPAAQAKIVEQMQASGNFTKNNPAEVAQSWFAPKPGPAQPINVGGVTYNPGDAQYAKMAKITGQEQPDAGAAHQLIADLRNPKVSMEELQAKLGDKKDFTSAYSMLHRTANVQSENMPGFGNGIVEGAGKVIKSTGEQTLGALMAGGALTGMVNPFVAIGAAAAPVIGGAAYQGGTKAAIKGSMSSVADVLTKGGETANTAQRVLGMAGGQTALGGMNTYNQVNPSLSSEEEDILKKYQ